MDQSNIYRNKLLKYSYKNAQNNNNIYQNKIQLYSHLCETIGNKKFVYLKFYHTVLNFLDMDIIKYISMFNKINDTQYDIVFNDIKLQLKVNELNIKYIEKYKSVIIFNLKENMTIIKDELLDDACWSELLSKLILWKILFLYEFNEKYYQMIKTYCKEQINTILFT